MPKLKNLPSLDVIHGFRGILDFYVRNGQAYARKWPVYPKSHQAAASIATAEKFGAVSKAFDTVGAAPLDAYTVDAADQTRTPRDLYMAAKYGNLHEATMSDFLVLATEIRDSLAALEDLLHTLGSIDTDDVQVDVKTSDLPTGAATNAKLDEVIAAMTTGQTLVIPFIIGDSTEAIATGQKGHCPIDFPCTIQACKMFADQPGSIVVDIWKDTYANFPPTDADTITAATPPTIATAQKSIDTDLTDWTIDLDAGDVLAFNVDSCTDIARVTVSLTVVRR